MIPGKFGHLEGNISAILVVVLFFVLFLVGKDKHYYLRRDIFCFVFAWHSINFHFL